MFLIILLFFINSFSFEFEYDFSFLDLPKNKKPLKQPVSVCAGPGEAVYLSDGETHRVIKYSKKGEFLKETGGLGSGSNNFDIPLGMTWDKGFYIYVCDSQNFRIVKLNKDLNHISFQSLNSYASDGTFCPRDISYSNDGSLYTCDLDDGEVLNIQTNGKISNILSLYFKNNPKTYWPNSIACVNSIFIVNDRKTRSLMSFDRYGNFIEKNEIDVKMPYCSLASIEDTVYALSDIKSRKIKFYNLQNVMIYELKTKKHGIVFRPGGIDYHMNKLYVIDKDSKNICVFSKK